MDLEFREFGVVSRFIWTMLSVCCCILLYPYLGM